MCLNQTNRIINHKPFTYKGTPALAFANSGVFSEYVVVRENQAVKIDPTVSLDVAALLACGVITGAGAVFNRAKVERGSTVAIFGAGGVGLSALQAASLSGAGEENSATGRHIRRLVDLRTWAKPLELPEERLTYHVLESDKPAAALVDYASMNDVARILIGAPAAGGLPWRFAGVGREVVGNAPCTVTVVRPRG
jgi:threonine dehydrogenase-like Zn-dependent dehydrogenase